MENIGKLLESINSDLINAEKTLIRKDRDSLRKKLSALEHLRIPLLIVFIIGYFYLFRFSLMKDSFFPLGVGLLIWLSGGIFAGYYFENLHKNIIPSNQQKILSIIKKHKDILETFNISEYTDEILKKVQTMESIISEDLDFLKEKRLRIFKQLMKKEIIFCTSVLLNLRSDLQLRLEEQKNSLEQAKFEVEKNIQGTTELEQVSELQKARLDRQIEQFEELQRILVKR